MLIKPSVLRILTVVLQVSPNNGYTVEVASHWISSYLLGDEMRLPKTPEAAFAETEREAAWLKQRYPEIPTALNASLTGDLAFWTYVPGFLVLEPSTHRSWIGTAGLSMSTTSSMTWGCQTCEAGATD